MHGDRGAETEFLQKFDVYGIISHYQSSSVIIIMIVIEGSVL